VRWKTFTLLCGKVTPEQDTTYQSLSESARFCGRNYKKHFGVFFRFTVYCTKNLHSAQPNPSSQAAVEFLAIRLCMYQWVTEFVCLVSRISLQVVTVLSAITRVERCVCAWGWGWGWGEGVSVAFCHRMLFPIM